MGRITIDIDRRTLVLLFGIIFSITATMVLIQRNNPISMWTMATGCISESKGETGPRIGVSMEVSGRQPPIAANPQEQELKAKAVVSSPNIPVSQQPDGAGADDASHASCLSRDEWRPMCPSRIAASAAHRYLILGNLTNFGTGTGHFMAFLGYFVRLSMQFNLELVLRPPLMNKDDRAIHDTFGLSSSLLNETHPNVQNARLEILNLTDREARLTREMSRTEIVYDPLAQELQELQPLYGDWAKNVPQTIGPPECTQARFVLRHWYWTAPLDRPSCDPYLPSSNPHAGRWVIAIHMRRGDIAGSSDAGIQDRNIPHSWYVQVVKKVLRAIAEVEDGAEVFVLVITQGRNREMVDEWGKPTDWNIETTEECTSGRLKCVQKSLLDTAAKESMGCLIGADVMIGSRSGFSHVAAMLLSNVKLVPGMWHEYATQDAVVIRTRNHTELDTEVSQLTLVDMLKTWKLCGSYAIAKSNPYVHGYRLRG